MNPVLASQTPRQAAGENKERYLAHIDHLMMVVLDISNGPQAAPDLPHHHVHEQISYIVSGRVIFFLGDAPYELGPGDMIAVPSDVPHCIQLLSESARVIDTFNPIRQEFLGS
ncbi:MAG: cupin domain-containing protein [Chloroflexi bacterium]|nr:cupin domain-containing protein [Chloroflexota bacterium]